jgi:chromosome segregation ATPase
MNTEIQLKNINDKIQQLLKQYQQLQKENSQLKKQAEKFQSDINAKTAQIYELQHQTDALKLGALAVNEEDKKILQKRIDTYLKEIDKCFNLLNTA